MRVDVVSSPSQLGEAEEEGEVVDHPYPQFSVLRAPGVVGAGREVLPSRGRGLPMLRRLVVVVALPGQAEVVWAGTWPAAPLEDRLKYVTVHNQSITKNRFD